MYIWEAQVFKALRQDWSGYRYSKEKKNKDSALEYSRVYRSGRRGGPAEEREKVQPERAEGGQGSNALGGKARKLCRAGGSDQPYLMLLVPLVK